MPVKIIRLAFDVLLCAVAALAVRYARQPITVSLPPNQPGATLCLSNLSRTDLRLDSGPAIPTGQSVVATATQDYGWSYSAPFPSTNRRDQECVVLH